MRNQIAQVTEELLSIRWHMKARGYPLWHQQDHNCDEVCKMQLGKPHFVVRNPRPQDMQSPGDN